METTYKLVINFIGGQKTVYNGVSLEACHSWRTWAARWGVASGYFIRDN